MSKSKTAKRSSKSAASTPVKSTPVKSTPVKSTSRKSIPRSTPPRGSSRKSPENKSGKKAILILVAIAGGVLIPLGIIAGILDTYGQTDRSRKADAIVILGAQVRPDGTAGLGLQMRTLHALRLYRKGVAPAIICTGGVGDNKPAEAVAAAQILLQHDVPRSAIELEDKSTSTWENASFAADICKRRGWDSVVVVSDPFHLWRAERNFQKNRIQAFGSPVAREQWRAQPLRKLFWASREALLVVRDFVLRRV